MHDHTVVVLWEKCHRVLDLIDKGNRGSGTTRSTASVIYPVAGVVHAPRATVVGKEADAQDPVESGGRGVCIRGTASGGDFAEGRVDDLDGDLNSRLVPQYDARRLHGPPIRRAVRELDTLGERAGTAGYLGKRNIGQGALEDPQSVTSGIQQDVIDRLAGCGAGGADRHADARLVEVAVRSSRRTEGAVHGDGKDVVTSPTGGHRKGRGPRNTPQGGSDGCGTCCNGCGQAAAVNRCRRMLDEVQVTCVVIFWVDPSEYVPVAVNCWVIPTAMLAVAGVTAIEDNVTAAVTVRVAVPGFTT